MKKNNIDTLLMLVPGPQARRSGQTSETNLLSWPRPRAGQCWVLSPTPFFLPLASTKALALRLGIQCFSKVSLRLNPLCDPSFIPFCKNVIVFCLRLIAFYCFSYKFCAKCL